MKHNFIKAILINFISAILIVNFDYGFTSNVTGFRERMAYSPAIAILMLVHIFITICCIFLIFRLLKVKEIKFKNIVDYFILMFSFISLVCTSLNLLIYNFSNNLIITENITSALYLILDMWALNAYINKFNLSKKKKWASAFIIFLYFLMLSY